MVSSVLSKGVMKFDTAMRFCARPEYATHTVNVLIVYGPYY